MTEFQIGQKIDELLSRRESLQDSLRNTSRLIKEGISAYKKLPNRWYVRNPSKKVIDYLEKKYKRKLQKYDYKLMSIGYGELHGEFSLIPHDVDYSWEITEDEFSHAMSVLK